MSLIFKALKKLKDQTPADHQDQSPKKERYVYSFRKLMLSPMLVTAVVLLLVVVGFTFFYFTKPTADRVTPPPIRKPPQAMVPASDSPPASGGTYMAKTVPPGISATDESLERDQSVPAVSEDTPMGIPSPAEQSASQARNLPAHTGDRPDSHRTSSVSQYLPRETNPEDIVPQVSAKPSSARLAASASQAKGVRTDLPETGAPPAQSTPSVDAPKPQEIKKPKGARTKASVAPSRKQRHKDILRSKSAQQAHITRLVARIKTNMHLYEEAETKRLIDELEDLKGSENAYVLKLRAYWHLRRDEVDAAVILLNRVLQRDAKDLEAGINMAVAEMKTNQFEAAQARLAKLREVYPENSLIPEMLQKLD
jgi:hypothetical protein